MLVKRHHLMPRTMEEQIAAAAAVALITQMYTEAAAVALALL
jgi:hypothetical protein